MDSRLRMDIRLQRIFHDMHMSTFAMYMFESDYEVFDFVSLMRFAIDVCNNTAEESVRMHCTLKLVALRLVAYLFEKWRCSNSGLHVLELWNYGDFLEWQSSSLLVDYYVGRIVRP